MPSVKTMPKVVDKKTAKTSKLPPTKGSQPQTLSTEYIQDDESSSEDSSNANSNSDNDSLPENPIASKAKEDSKIKTQVSKKSTSGESEDESGSGSESDGDGSSGESDEHTSSAAAQQKTSRTVDSDRQEQVYMLLLSPVLSNTEQRYTKNIESPKGYWCEATRIQPPFRIRTCFDRRDPTDIPAIFKFKS
jgi:hypothetical protein